MVFDSNGWIELCSSEAAVMTVISPSSSKGVSEAAHCPDCHQIGKAVKSITLESLLTKDALVRVKNLDGFRFCSTPGCKVAYFRSSSDDILTITDVRVPVGQKLTEPSRTLCYCFGHTVAQIESEVVATGTSTVMAEIAAKCKQGLDRCPESNPQGSCCMGNVKAVISESKIKRDPRVAAAQLAVAADRVTDNNCCDQSDVANAVHVSAKRGAITTAGAVFAAALSSACCWLPLLLLAFGASAAGVAGFFERYRPIFLGVTTVLLTLAFFLAYRRPVCAPDETCAIPNSNLRRFNKAAAWAVAVIVIAFATFPQYIGTILGRGSTGAPETGATGTPDSIFRIEGMTCAGCASILETLLAQMPGVARAEVSYEDKTAKVYFEPENALRPPDAQLLSVIRSGGFKGIPYESSNTNNGGSVTGSK